MQDLRQVVVLDGENQSKNSHSAVSWLVLRRGVAPRIKIASGYWRIWNEVKQMLLYIYRYMYVE